MYFDKLSKILFWKQNFLKEYQSYSTNIFPQIDDKTINLLIKEIEKKVNRFRICKISIPREFFLEFCYRVCPVKYYYPNYFINNYLLSKYEISKNPDFYYDQFLMYYRNKSLLKTKISEFINR